jgi:hypothetical protein
VYPCLIPLLVFTVLISSWSIRTLTHLSIYNSVIKFLLQQSIRDSFRIYFNLVQLTRPNVFYQSMKQIHNSSSMFKAHYDIILNFPIVFPVPFRLLIPKLSYTDTS